ncbi:MAG: hypothetical protein ACYTGW_16320 [Planctomycetota bacterium]|jgi:hypothetical protein
MRTTFLLSALTLLGAADLAAQHWHLTRSPQALEAWIGQRFQGRDVVPLRSVLGAARHLGWVKTAADAKLLKRQFRAIARQRGRTARFLDLMKTPALEPSAGPLAATVEKEYNDSEGFANDVGTVTTVAQTISGSLAANTVDSFAVTVPVDGVLQVAASVTGTAPEVLITSADGDEVWGMASSKAPPLDVEVPKGRYHVLLYQAQGTATYSLSLKMKVQPVSTLALGKQTQVALNTNLKALKVVLAQDGRVTLNLSSTGSADTHLWLLSSSWRYLFDVDDAGSTGTDAGLNALLPKGVYYVYLTSDAATTATITANFKAARIPLLGTAAINGTIPSGEEDFDLYRMVVGNAELVTLAIRGNGASPISDSYLFVYDSNMALSLESDDENASNSTLSSFTATMPPGTYYAASTGFYTKGGYTISKNTGKGSTVTAQAGTNAVTITTLDTAATLKLSLLTPSRIEFNVVEGTLIDAQVFVIDAKSGLSVGWEDDAVDATSCRFGTHLPAGDYFVIVKDWDGGTGTVDVRIIPPMQRWGTAFTARARGHEGNPLFLVIGTKQVPAQNPLLGLVTGNLLIDLQTAVIFPLGLPTGGILDFQAGMKPNTGFLVQTVEFETTTSGAYSNLLK